MLARVFIEPVDPDQDVLDLGTIRGPICYILLLRVHLFSLIFIIQASKMDQFKNVREVTSPLSQTHSPFETHQSIVISRKTGFDFNPTQLDFKPSLGQVESKFSKMSMIQSQVIHGNMGSSYIQSKNGFGVDPGLKASSIGSRFGGGGNEMERSRAVDPMKDSTVSYMRSIYRGTANISEERLRQITDNFLRLYGTDREITQNGIRNMQRQAHSDANKDFEQSSETTKGLLTVLDTNRDGRVSQEDMISVARRYLSFQKKQIVYTPIVEERLAVARRLFKQFDVERKGYLTERQVPNLLSETYKCLGKTFTATKEDVRSWMKLTDGDGDGHVTLPDYEQSIIRALKKQGVRIYDE